MPSAENVVRAGTGCVAGLCRGLGRGVGKLFRYGAKLPLPDEIKTSEVYKKLTPQQQQQFSKDYETMTSKGRDYSDFFNMLDKIESRYIFYKNSEEDKLTDPGEVFFLEGDNIGYLFVVTQLENTYQLQVREFKTKVNLAERGYYLSIENYSRKEGDLRIIYRPNSRYPTTFAYIDERLIKDGNKVTEYFKNRDPVIKPTTVHLDVDERNKFTTVEGLNDLMIRMAVVNYLANADDDVTPTIIRESEQYRKIQAFFSAQDEELRKKEKELTQKERRNIKTMIDKILPPPRTTCQAPKASYKSRFEKELANIDKPASGWSGGGGEIGGRLLHEVGSLKEIVRKLIKLCRNNEHKRRLHEALDDLHSGEDEKSIDDFINLLRSV